jgi:hypothetical protein
MMGKLTFAQKRHVAGMRRYQVEILRDFYWTSSKDHLEEAKRQTKVGQRPNRRALLRMAWRHRKIYWVCVRLLWENKFPYDIDSIE